METKDTLRDTARKTNIKLQKLNVPQTTSSLAQNLLVAGLYVTGAMAIYNALIMGTGFSKNTILGKMMTKSAPQLASASSSFFLLAGAVRLAAAINYEEHSHHYLALLTYVIPFITTVFESFVYHTASLKVPNVQLTLFISAAMIGLMGTHQFFHHIRV